MTVSTAALADVYRRLTHVCSTLDVNITAENLTLSVDSAADGRSVGAAGLLSVPEALAAVVDGESDRITAAHGKSPRRDVAASRLLHHYLWSVGLLFSGPWYLGRVVPHIPAGAVHIDPAAGSLTLDVRRVTGERADGGPEGAGRLRDAVAGHMGPVLDAFAPHVRRGPRALWGMATDDLASGLWSLGRALGEEERGIREATVLLPGATAPFPGAAAFRVLRGASDRTHHTRTRLGCCLHYAVTPQDPCVTCPRMTDAARLQRLEPA